MEFQIRQNPSFAVSRAIMGPGETLTTRAGAMMMTSAGLEMKSEMQGGLKKGLMRSMLGGESLFMSTYTAGPSGGWIDTTAHLPGDMVVLPVNGAYNLTHGAYICGEASVTIDTKWGGWKNLGGGEGGFLVRCEGTGQVVAAAYGAIEQYTLGQGETMVLDSGHLVGFSDGTQYITRKMASGIMQTLKSGEGLVFEFSGPGTLLVQTRNTQEYIAWMESVLPIPAQ